MADEEERRSADDLARREQDEEDDMDLEGHLDIRAILPELLGLRRIMGPDPRQPTTVHTVRMPRMPMPPTLIPFAAYWPAKNVRRASQPPH